MARDAYLSQDPQSVHRNQWFNTFIGELRTDELMIELGTIDPEKGKFYDNMFSGNIEQILFDHREKISMALIERMVIEFIKLLLEKKIRPEKLAFELSNYKVLVWSEIDMDDEESERELIIAEAQINAKYSKYGLHISTTIVETQDGLPIPPHYQEFTA